MAEEPDLDCIPTTQALHEAPVGSTSEIRGGRLTGP
jgi:hypothetical protein